MTSTLKLSLLGRPTVLYSGEPLTGFKTTKALALLGYLAVTQQPHSRAALANLLWGEDPSDKARNSLRNTLSNLNKLLPHHLDITRESVVWRKDSPYWLDIDEFQQKSNAMDSPLPDPEALQAAMDLYRGDFWAEFFVDGAPEFEAWLLAQREHWRHVALDILQVQADILMDARAYPQAAEVLERVLDIEPWAEEVHRQLMAVRSRTGDFNAALAQYELCRKTLAAEMDVEPMPETTALYERIQVARQGREHNLPADTTPFVGRAAELTQIHNLITNPDARIVSIVGLGGMGKTRLALEAARQALQEQALLFLNGICFVPLASVQSVDGIPTAIFDALGISPSGSEHLATQLISYLQNKELLLVLDNFEHLQAGGALLSRMLDAGPDVKLLVTGREPLDLAAEWRLDLEGLPYPDGAWGVESREWGIGRGESLQGDSSTPQLPIPYAQWEAVDLFVQMAQQILPAYQLQDEDAPHVQQLCQIVAGMPLALKLAASWLRTMPLASIVAEIERSLDILSTRMRDLPPRQRSMRVVFDYTWGLLTPEQQQTMAALSVFRGGFREQAAIQVAGATPTLLADLVDRWLLQYQITVTGGRYTIHELTRQYSGDQLRHTDDSGNNHSRYFAHFAQQCYTRYLDKQYRLVIGDLHQEIDNVRTAWQWLVTLVAAGEQVDFAVEHLNHFIHPLAWFYRQRGQYLEGKNAYQAAVQAIGEALGQTDIRPDADHRLRVARARLQIRLAMFHYFVGEYEAVDQLLEAALIVVQDAQFIEEEALALEIWARPTRRRGDYARTKELAQRSGDLFKQAGNELGVIQALSHIATTAADEGDYRLAEKTGRQIISFYRELNDSMSIANWLTNLANTYVRWEKPQAARPLLEEADTIAQADNNRYLLMFARCNLSHVLRGVGDFEQADVYGRESLTLAREMGDQRWVAANLNNLSHNYLCQEAWSTAQRYAQESLTITHTIQSEHDALGDLSCLARAWAYQGNVEAALRLLLFVEQHPSALKWDKAYNAALLEELSTELPPAVIANAESWRAAKTLDGVVAYVNSLSAKV